MAHRRREIGGRRETNERKKIRAGRREGPAKRANGWTDRRMDGPTDGRTGARRVAVAGEGLTRGLLLVCEIRLARRSAPRRAEPGRGTEKSAAGAGPPLGAGSTWEPDRPER